MLDVLLQLGLFSAKAIITVVMILGLLAGIIALLSKGKSLSSGNIHIKNLNLKFHDIAEQLNAEILTKKAYKKWVKETEKASKDKPDQPNVFVLNFDGDLKASAANALREEVTAIIGIAKPGDEVVLRLESGGGMVHGYGLAAAQLARLRDKGIPLTVSVDKIAASGGYLMAVVANKILAAPFAIIGSIGVLVQLPNFNRLLKDKHIEFEQLTAGDYKRTLTMFGHNTEEGREKLQEEIEAIHGLFKHSIQTYRPQCDVERIATGEHWVGTQAFDLRLVDEIKTSDAYLLAKNDTTNLYEITYQAKKSLGQKLFAVAQAFQARYAAGFWF